MDAGYREFSNYLPNGLCCIYNYGRDIRIFMNGLSKLIAFCPRKNLVRKLRLN